MQQRERGSVVNEGAWRSFCRSRVAHFIFRVHIRRVVAAALIIAATVMSFGGGTLQSQVSSPCGAGINPIVCENWNSGDPPATWDVGHGDSTIQGFTTDISVDQGGTIRFKVKTTATGYHLDIYRMGFYSGMGARKIATLLPSATLPQTQPACLTEPATGLVDCGNWNDSASWTVPDDAPSGIYFAKATRDDNGGASHIFFVVRDDDGASDVLFQTSDTTWQAHNDYGGNSLFVGQPVGRAYKVSYNRPFITRAADTGQQSWVFNAEYPMVRWLEANGYNVSYTTGVDTDRRGAELLEHRVFLSVGDDEYWSAQQRLNVEAARDAGVNLAFLSGSELFWKTRWENSIDGSGTSYRTLVSYKETHANAKIDPAASWTGTWRDPRFSPPADGGRPENALTGTLFMVNGTRNDPMTVTAAQGAHRFWRNTSVAALAVGQSATFAAGILGDEWDEDPDNGFRPAGLQRLSSTTIDVSPLYLQDYGSSFGAGTATHNMTLYRASSGALVFGAGTVQYSWGLDSNHDRVGPPEDVRLQQATVNLLADMGVQPDTLQAGLVGASQSLDTQAPTSVITSPANGATVQSRTAITITGTASESGGGTLAAVEISTDGGVTWDRATGTTSWTYSWTPVGPGSANSSATIRSRAVDDSGNLESPAAGVTVLVTPVGGLVASYGFDEGSGTTVTDSSGLGHSGTVAGAQRTTGRVGGALSFDGVNDWVTIADRADLDLTNGMTIEAWVRPSVLSGWRTAIMKEAAGNLVYALYAHDNAPRPAAYVRLAQTVYSAGGSAALPLNTWTHIATTFDGATTRLYVNGVEAAQRAATGSMSASTRALRIGGNSVWGQFFAGIIDEVRVYRRALAAAEIRADMTTAVSALPDNTPPSVSMTSPAQGAMVSGTVTVSATAADDVAVAGVTFFVDGTQLGAEDTVAPYSIDWVTTSVINGSHALTARARDGAGNSTTSAAVTVTVSNTAIPAGLVAAYGFEEGVGSTTADASGSSNTGTITGATWTSTGRYGNALTFNGTSNDVTVADANSLDLTSAMTVEAWIYPTGLGGWRTVALKESTGGLSYALYASGAGGSTPEAVVNTSTGDKTAAGSSVLLNTWTHVAATFDTTTLRLFVNGTQAASLPVGQPIVASANPLRIGGNSVWGEHFAGRIDEVRVYNRALTAAEIQSDMSRPIVGGSSDTTPPSVSITAPTPGAVVSGTFTITADAADAGGVGGVQFRIDGANEGPEDSTLPYEYLWNTSAFSNGGHTITAVARDSAGNSQTSAPVTVSVSNTTATDPAIVGAWSAPQTWPLVAVHAAVLSSGKVLMWQDRSGSTARLWDPATGVFTPTPAPSNIYCAGHATVADGRLVVIGGHGAQGTFDTNIFDPGTETWTAGAKMANRRWYPTATTLADGRVLAMSGGSTCFTCLVDVPEVYDPVANTWTALTPAKFAAPYYSFDFLLPNGRVLYAGASEESFESRVLDIQNQTWTAVDASPADGGSAAMYKPGFIIKSGTAREPTYDAVIPSQPTTYVMDTTVPSPRWRQTAPMAFPRAYHNLTMLPDGSVLATGGGRNTDGITLSEGVLAAEIWSPVTETWTTVASMTVPRLYHSTAFLLPDGRVVSAGGGAKDQVPGATDQANAEIYSPPYLFKGPRPTITSAPPRIEYGSTFFVETADTISAVALIRPGAPTHAFDENQRFLNLTFSATTGGLNVQAPANGNLAPPGYYMLFVLNGNGVPSIATFVRLPAPHEDTQPPTAPTGLTATGSIGSIALAWNAASDNFAVTGYDVHRSTTTGFSATAANRIAQTSNTSYTDAAVTAGTYYYVVKARDAAGNLSLPSNEANGTATTDTVGPAVAISSPAGGATVSSTISVTANASDNVSVAGVQFLLDGVALGAEDAASPYSVSWNTRTASNGVHTLTARARDGAGNTATSAPVTVTVSNTTPTGLVAAYAFNEGAGTAAADATGTGHTGTISGATWTTAGKNGNALSFDGVNDTVSVADANDLDLTNGMTLEAWVRPAALADWNTVIMKEGSATTLAYSLYANDGSPWPAVTVRIGNADRSAVAASQLALNTWTHLAGTYDGTNLRLYVNGVQVDSRAQTGSMPASTRTLRIGGNTVWGEYFKGLIDDVRIYNRALTAAEIQSDMNTSVQ